jgi:predicted TIM-barrel fold metal-dependent hydrolase
MPPTATPAEVSRGTVDIHTFVAPALECVYQESSEALRSHWPRIEEYLALTCPTPGVGDWPSSYLRVGNAAAASRGDERGASPAPFPLAAAELEPEQGILHDNPAGRLRAMDELGTSTHVISPALRLDVDDHIGSQVTRMVLDAYNRYVISYCAAAPNRLKAVVQLHGHEPHWSGDQLEEMAEAESVAAFTLRLLPKIAPDSPYFTPIWRAVAQTGLPLLHRPLAGMAWWTPRRLLSYLSQTGILDTYPDLKLIFAGWPAGWVAGWCEAPSSLLLRYATEGRVFVGIDASESAEDVRRIVDVAGDGWLLWQTGFPFGSDGADELSFLPEASRDKVLAGNATACLARGAGV